MTGITFGDVLVVLSIFIGTAATLWALIVGMALMFGKKAATARQAIERKPIRMFGAGLFHILVPGTIGMIMLNLPNPIAKLIGTGLVFGLIGIAAIGGGGLAMMTSERIREMEPGLAPYSALAKGAGYIVGAGMVPLFGWFFYTPVALAIMLGGGMKAVFAKQPTPVFAPVNTEAATRAEMEI